MSATGKSAGDQGHQQLSRVGELTSDRLRSSDSCTTSNITMSSAYKIKSKTSNLLSKDVLRKSSHYFGFPQLSRSNLSVQGTIRAQFRTPNI
ncbi:hypothetical protein NL676_024067 [Syzygium grande]|nr:hypothetical protein NL676_024067 [Syzygium grande]